MSLKIDPSKCLHDGFCAEVCPLGIIKMENKTPVSLSGSEKVCINCGHCVSVCPSSAISLPLQDPSQCLELKEGWRLTKAEAEQFLKGRRSVRRYKDKAVEKEVLNEMIDMARYAPSGINLQPVKWLVIYDNREVRRISSLVIDWMRKAMTENPAMANMFAFQRLVAASEAGFDPICRNAPHLVFAYGLEADRTALQACTIAMTYFELAALPFNVGTCWAGYVQIASNNDPAFLRELKLQSRYRIMGAMLTGYPKFEYRRVPVRNTPNITWRE